MRRNLTIAAVAVIVIGLIIAGYFLFFAKNSGLTVQNGVSNENPFGEGAGNVAPSGTGANSGTDTNGAGQETAAPVAPHLVEITAKPVAAGFIALDASTTPVVSLASTTPSATSATPATPLGAPMFSVEVRYIDRESGNMYAYESAGGTTKRLTNHTAPGVEEASWLPDGSEAYIRFLTDDADGSEHVDTYALPADGTNGFLLPRDLSEVIPRSLASLFTLMPNTSGSVGTLEKADGSANTTLFTSPLSSIAMQRDGANLVAYTKPSSSLPGYAFLVNGTTGSFSQILGPLTGLTVLPNLAGSKMLFSYVNSGALTLASFDPAAKNVITLPVATLSDKCVWAPSGTSAYCFVPASIPTGVTLPDAWYQGTAAFADKLWEIDFSSRVATLVADLPQIAPEPIDGTALTLDQKGSTLVFMNKRDDSLWAYTF